MTSYTILIFAGNKEVNFPIDCMNMREIFRDDTRNPMI